MYRRVSVNKIHRTLIYIRRPLNVERILHSMVEHNNSPSGDKWAWALRRRMETYKKRHESNPPLSFTLRNKLLLQLMRVLSSCQDVTFGHHSRSLHTGGRRIFANSDNQPWFLSRYRERVCIWRERLQGHQVLGCECLQHVADWTRADPIARHPRAHFAGRTRQSHPCWTTASSPTQPSSPMSARRLLVESSSAMRTASS